MSRGVRPAAQRFLYYVGEIIIGIEPAKSKHQALVIGPNGRLGSGIAVEQKISLRMKKGLK